MFDIYKETEGPVGPRHVSSNYIASMTVSEGLRMGVS